MIKVVLIVAIALIILLLGLVVIDYVFKHKKPKEAETKATPAPLGDAIAQARQAAAADSVMCEKLNKLSQLEASLAKHVGDEIPAALECARTVGVNILTQYVRHKDLLDGESEKFMAVVHEGLDCVAKQLSACLDAVLHQAHLDLDVEVKVLEQWYRLNRSSLR